MGNSRSHLFGSESKSSFSRSAQKASRSLPDVDGDHFQVDSCSFAIVEVFTSQSSSSCQVADVLVREIVETSQQLGLRVFPLCFHVDYLNQTGWRDIFSNPLYTDRQKFYARTLLDDSSLFLPHVIVNGTSSFLGRQRDAIMNVIHDSLRQPGLLKLSLTPEYEKHRSLMSIEYYAEINAVACESGSLSSQLVIHCALVERGIKTQITDGQNKGRTLQHDNVVRSFVSQRVSPFGQGSITLPVPPNLIQNNTGLIAFVQDMRDMQILGAEAVELKTVFMRHKELMNVSPIP
eukprot:GILJ01014223.1.p1 GENE.GILJ01014223.1~~GILJ01014223.1.p1  ORF type:complete len:291 (+),score=27.86 GILJ01014223.1:60-932(+)